MLTSYTNKKFQNDLQKLEKLMSYSNDEEYDSEDSFHGGGEDTWNEKGTGIMNYTEFDKTNSICIAFQGQISNNGNFSSNLLSSVLIAKSASFINRTLR